jgi:hypothetical protein
MAAKTPEPTDPRATPAPKPGTAVARVAGTAPAPSGTAVTGPGPGPAGTTPAGAPPTGSTPVVAAPGGTPRSGSERGGGVAVVVAVCAVLVALASALIAVYALDVARQAKSRAAAAESVADRAAHPGRPTSPTPSPAVSSSPSATAGPTYVPELLRANLHIPAAEGCVSIFVDVDTLQTGVFEGHEFYLSSCLGPLTVRVDQAAAAVSAPAGANAETCAALLAGTVGNPQLALPATPGQTFCLLTARDEGTNPGQPQRLAIVEIRTVNPDHSVAAYVSTYRVSA